MHIRPGQRKRQSSGIGRCAVNAPFSDTNTKYCKRIKSSFDQTCIFPFVFCCSRYEKDDSPVVCAVQHTQKITVRIFCWSMVTPRVQLKYCHCNVQRRIHILFLSGKHTTCGHICYSACLFLSLSK